MGSGKACSSPTVTPGVTYTGNKGPSGERKSNLLDRCIQSANLGACYAYQFVSRVFDTSRMNNDFGVEMRLRRESISRTTRCDEARAITCSRDCTSYTSCSKRNKRNSPTAIPPTASTYAFPTNYRFIVRSSALSCASSCFHVGVGHARIVLCRDKLLSHTRREIMQFLRATAHVASICDGNKRPPVKSLPTDRRAIKRRIKRGQRLSLFKYPPLSVRSCLFFTEIPIPAVDGRDGARRSV